MAEQEALARFKQEEVSAAKRPELPVYRPKETRKKIGFSTGTGFLVSPSGHIVTNFHVVEDAKEVTVVADGHEYPASVVTVDSENDVALLKTEVHGTPISIGGRSELSVADEVMTLGYPLVRLQGQALKASFGRVNALSGSTDDPRFIQIDVPIQPGNSGGPLVNEQGQLVGVVTATLNQVVALRETGAIPQNVNYAVKAGYVTPLLQGLELRTSNTAPVGFRELAAEYKNSVFLIIAK
jgi:S1-C subfamily serine protease